MSLMQGFWEVFYTALALAYRHNCLLTFNEQDYLM